MVLLVTNAQQCRVSKGTSRTLVKDCFSIIYLFFFRGQHLHLGSIYSFELMKIMLRAHIQRTFS